MHEFFGSKSKRLVRREAIGVAGLITPWNFPFMLNLSKIVPALMAGCTAVLKAAPDTPWSATWLGKLIAEETELPPGVLNIVTARDPAEVGDQLTGDPRVDVVSFTGSTAIGKHIMRRGADGLKRVFLELGGKSAQIFLDDADLLKLVPAAGAGICMHGGQGCAITTRMLLPRSRYAECVEALKVAYQNLPYGDPTVMGNIMGPLINAKQRERVLGYIEKGKAEGARCLAGGGRPAKLAKGWFVEPTLFVDVDPNATIAQEEIFGPVLSVIPYDTEEDAVRIANNSQVRPLRLRARGLARTRHVRREADPHRHDLRERRPVVRARLSVRRLQGERHRPRARRGGLRGVPADQDDRVSRVAAAVAIMTIHS